MDGFIDSHPSAPSCLSKEPPWASRKRQGALGTTRAQHKRGAVLRSPGEPGDPGLPYAGDFVPKDDPSNAHSSGLNQRSEVFDFSTSRLLRGFLWSFPGRIRLQGPTLSRQTLEELSELQMSEKRPMGEGRKGN